MASILPSQAGLVLEHHFGTNAAASLLNHATGTTVATEVGAPTYGAGYMDIQGHATVAQKGMDLGYQVPETAHLIAVFDPNTAVSIASAAGVNTVLKSTGRVWFDDNPSNNETLTINGQAITFKTAGAVGFQVNIGATVQDTAAATAALINANPGTFAVTAYSPTGNSVLNLRAVAAGTAGNSIALAETSAGIRLTAAGATSAVTAMSGGTDGESVTVGLVHASTNIQGRNSNIGTGGLASIAIPGASNYFYYSSPLRLRDFPKLRLYSGGALAARSGGTTNGRIRATSGNLNLALGGQGTGNAKIAFLAMYNRALTEAQDLAAYLAVQSYLAGVGITVN